MFEYHVFLFGQDRICPKIDIEYDTDDLKRFVMVMLQDICDSLPRMQTRWKVHEFRK